MRGPYQPPLLWPVQPVRYKLIIAYDGSGFCGWQKQEPPAGPDAPAEAGQARAARAYSPLTPRIEGAPEGRVSLRTVQGVLESAVRRIAREPGIELVGASRTDSGVHAWGQVAAFTSFPGQRGIGWPLERGPERLRMALNAHLPDDVLVREAQVVPAGFDPIAGARRKRYTYTWVVSRTRPLWERGRVVWVAHAPAAVDARAMHEAAGLLVGERDFAGFAAAGHGRLSTVRTVYACAVDAQQHDDALRVRLTIEGNGFLWNMVRIIAGTLLEVGLGRRPAADSARALRTLQRTDAGPTAPAHGLCLERVWYEGECAGETEA